MALTPATLTRHELIGLPVSVASATDPNRVGIAGEVVMETTRTLTVEDSEGRSPSASRTQSGSSERVWQVPKAGTTFEFTVPDGQTVSVDGDRLLARPARRTERTGDSKWR